MKNYRFIITMLSFAFLFNASAGNKNKIFYDSKSNLVGITGAYDKLAANGFTVKFLENPVDIPEIPGTGKYDCGAVENIMNQNDVGKKILDYLFMKDGDSLSEERLRQRAYQNVQRTDIERAEIGVIDKETILKDDILPILANNFIYLQRQEGTHLYWIVLKVQITKATQDEVYNSWRNEVAYSQIKVPIKYVASGVTKANTEIRNKFLRDISKKVPEFAVRGQVIGRNPFKTNFGLDNGLRNMDRVRIYRQVMKDSTMYSKRISVTRVGKISANDAILYTLAGGQASYKKGDVAVLDQDKNSSISVLPWYKPKDAFGLYVMWEYRLFFKKGLSLYSIAEIGAGAYKDFQRMYAFSSTSGPELYYSPIILNAGLGLGVGYHFAHAMEIEPYVLGQYDGLLFNSVETSDNSKNTGDHIDDKTSALWVSAVRIPIGAKININVFYPVQLSIGADYGILIKLKKEEGGRYYRADKYFFNPMGYKRSGLTLYAGIRVNL